MTNLRKKYPVLSWAFVAALLNAVQFAAIPMPNWLHVVFLIALHTAGALAGHSQVSPVEK